MTDRYPTIWLLSLLCVALPIPAGAQLTPDDTLGSEASTVTSDVPIQGTPAELIEGGAIRGRNLFHSFSDFNVETLQRVYFANPADIDTILTRVTGGHGSTIDGTLGVDGLADLYLLNPNGVVFGPNAQLDIRGSFVVSTADSWHLENGAVFSAIDPDAPPLLAVTLTPGLQYGTTQQADVTNAGNLAVAPEESLVLLGETVTSSGTLTAPGGQVQLLGNQVGLLETGRIEVSSPTGGGTVYLGGGLQGQGVLPTAQQAFVGPAAQIIANATASGNGGEVVVWSDAATQFYGTVAAQGGAVAGNGGFVEVSSADWLDFRGQVDTSAPNGDMGTLLLDPTTIRVVEDALAETFDVADVAAFAIPDIGNDGETLIGVSAINGATSTVVLQATESISFEAPIFTTNPFVGLEAIAFENIAVNQPIETFVGPVTLISQDIAISAPIASFGGDITIFGENSIALDNGAIVESGNAFGIIDAGQVLVQTSGLLSLVEGAQLSAGAFDTANGGNINIFADAILLDGEGTTALTSIESRVNTDASGFGGDITVEARDIAIVNGAFISALTQGEGDAGNLAVTAERIELGQGSIIGSLLRASGNGGDVAIQADAIVATDNALISTSNQGEGVSGRLAVTAERIDLDNLATISSTVSDSGDGGDVVVQADVISLTNLANISTSNEGEGTSGTLSIIAERLELDGGVVDAAVLATGNGGDVTVQVDEIFVFNLAGITTLSAGTGTPGDLLVSAERIELTGVNATIGADVFASGDGGDVTVQADEIIATNRAIISTTNLGEGTSGNLLVTAGRLELDNADIDSIVFNAGNGGEVTVQADEIVASNGALISTFNNGTGASGDLAVTTGRLELDDAGIDSRVLDLGEGGNVTIQADAIVATNEALISTLNIGEGTSGDVLVTAERIELDEGATINSLVFGSGDGGNVTVQADAIVATNFGVISTLNEGEGTSGNLSVTAGRLALNGSLISSVVLASGDGGDVIVQADTIAAANEARISTLNNGEGTSGNLSVTAERIELDTDAAIDSGVFASGNGGNVTVQADTITASNGTRISTLNNGKGDSGAVLVTAERIELDGVGTGIDSTVLDSGNGGEVMVQADDITATNRAFITTANQGSGDSGNLSVITERLELDNADIDSTVSSSGNGGNVTIRADDITAANRAFIATANQGTGDSGSLTVIADRLELDNADIESAVSNSGNGGNVTVQAEDIAAINESNILTTNFGSGNSGRLLVTADQIRLDNSSTINSLLATEATGIGGEIILQATDIVITDSSGITTSTFGTNDAGDIEIQASNRIELDGSFILSASTSSANSGDFSLMAGEVELRNESVISAGALATEFVPNAAEAAAGIIDITANRISLDDSEISTTSNFGDGGEIFVDADNFLLLRNGSDISTTAGALTEEGGNGGSIDINAPFVIGVLSEDSNITANAFEGDGGRVFISALDIIGLEFQDELTPFSDITASSEAGDAGITTFNQLIETNPEDGFNEIPVDLADPTSLISRQCALQASNNASEFTVVGRGGLPPDPSQLGTADTFLEDLGTVPANTTMTEERSRNNEAGIETPTRLTTVREAQSWVQDENGHVYLVSATPQSTQAMLPSDASCQSPAVPIEHRETE